MRRTWSLKAYAYATLLVVALPLSAVLLIAHHQAWRALDEDAAGQLHAMAGLAAEDADRWFIDTRDALDRLAGGASARGSDVDGCAALAREPDAASARWVELSLVDRAGRRICTIGGNTAAPAGDDSQLTAIAGRRLADGRGFWVDAVTGPPGSIGATALAGVPLAGPDGAKAGALVARIDARRFVPARRAGGGLLAQSVVAFVDRSHRLTGPVDGDGVREGLLNGLGNGAGIRGAGGQGTSTAPDGTEWLYGYAEVPIAQGWIVIALPAEFADPAAHTALRHALLWALGALAAGLVALAWAAHRFARPLSALAAAIRHVAAGDRTVQAPEGGPLELVELARRTNQMGAALARSSDALRASEARYRALFETSKDAIVGIDRASRIVFANEAVQRILGYAPAELVGRDVALLQPPRLRDAYREGLREFLQTGTAGGGRTSVETRALHRDGREVAVEFTYSALDSGTENLIVGILRDITERRAVHARLKESEARFRSLADSAPALIWMADVNGLCTYLNRAWSVATGHAPEQDLGDKWLENVHPDDRARCREANARALADRAPFTVEFRLRHHDGEYRWVLNQGAPRMEGRDRLAGFIGSAVDIHDRVVADQRIRRLTTLYAALSEVNEAIVRLHEPPQLFQRVCDIVVQHGFGGSIVGLLDPDGRHLRIVAAAGARAPLIRGVAIATDGSDPRHDIPIMLAVRNAAPFVSNDRAHDPRTVPIRDPVIAAELLASAAFPLRQQGRVVGAFDVYADEVNYFDAELVRLLELLADDVSFALQTFADQATRDAAEAALRQLNTTLEERVRERTRALESANRELEAFSYSTSHDLRAPLRAISGFTDIVLDRHASGLDPEAQGYLKRVQAAARRMSQLINDLLDLSRVSRAGFERRETSLSELATEIVAELREGHPGRDADVEIAPGLVAQADPGLVRLLLANLLGNAWKFTSRRAHARITFGRAIENGTSVYFVRDNGAGFAMEHADKLFAPFQRLHGEREFPGTGIGLALAQRVVNRHGGRIWANATPDAGATFYFTLEA